MLEIEEYEDESKLMKALSHPARLAILEVLRDRERCVCHLEATLGLRQAYISQQLMVLRDAGLVAMRREGWNIYYGVVRPEIYNVLDAVRQLAGRSAPEVVVQPTACTCPTCTGKAGHRATAPSKLSGR